MSLIPHSLSGERSKKEKEEVSFLSLLSSLLAPLGTAIHLLIVPSRQKKTRKLDLEDAFRSYRERQSQAYLSPLLIIAIYYRAYKICYQK